MRGKSGSARFGGGQHLIAEADESDASFLHLLPQLAVVTNIDQDHLGAYDGNSAALRMPSFASHRGCLFTARCLPAEMTLAWPTSFRR